MAILKTKFNKWDKVRCVDDRSSEFWLQNGDKQLNVNNVYIVSKAGYLYSEEYVIIYGISGEWYASRFVPSSNKITELEKIILCGENDG